MGDYPALVLFSVLRIWSELCFSSSGFVVLCFENLVIALFCSFARISRSLRTSFKGREKVKNHILDQMLVFGSRVDLELVVYTSRDNLVIEFVGFLACSCSSF
jgi:hypothetical protein